MRLPAQHLRRFLRSPRVIVAEVAGITLGGLAMAIVPQGAARGEDAGFPADLLSTLALDRVARSPWFLTLIALAAVSLSLVIADQVRRAWRLSKRVPAAPETAAAPYRREAVFPAGTLPDGPPAEIRVRGSLGIWGSPLFHIGILLVIFSGLLRMLFGADAAVDLIAGETLLPRGGQYGVQRPGLLASPFVFPEPVRLDELRVDRYPSGEAKSVEGTVRLGEGPRAANHPIAINNPIRIGIHSLYVGNRGGAAALVEVTREDGSDAVERRAILLRDSPGGGAGEVVLADGTLLRATADEGGIGRVPERIDLRAVRGGALAGLSRLGRGKAMTLPEGTRITLAGILPWVQLSGQRDISTPLVYAGFLLACLGGVLMLVVVPVESVVLREKVDDGVRLTVLMRPRKFVPLFSPAFEELWRRGSAGLEAVGQNAGNERS